MPRYFAIIPAAGTGARFGASRPKQYLDLIGRPLIYHTLAALGEGDLCLILIDQVDEALAHIAARVAAG